MKPTNYLPSFLFIVQSISQIARYLIIHSLNKSSMPLYYETKKTLNEKTR